MNAMQLPANPVETDLVERYLQGRLPPEEEAAFEEYLLENPAAAAAVEDAERLRGGLREIAATSAARELARSPARRAAYRRTLPLAAAALLAVGLLPFWWSQRQLSRLEEEAAPGPAAIVVMSALRGDAGGPVLALGKAGEQLVFALEMGASFGELYQVSLETGGRRAFSVAGLRADPTGRLVFLVPARLLQPGAAEFVVEGGDPPRPAGRFPLQVEAAPGSPD